MDELINVLFVAYLIIFNLYMNYYNIGGKKLLPFFLLFPKNPEVRIFFSIIVSLIFAPVFVLGMLLSHVSVFSSGGKKNSFYCLRCFIA